MEPGNMETLRHKASNGVSRINLRNSKIVIPVVLSVSLCAVVSRVYLKLRHTRKLHLDDYILLFATVCFIAATGIYYNMVDRIYINLLLGTDPSAISFLTTQELMALFTQQLNILKMQAAFYFLVSTTIVSVKIGFLYFFGKVVELKRRLRLFWKITVLTTAVCGLYFMVVPFIACPHFGPESVLQCQGPQADLKLDILAYLGFATDCFTDILIVAIPVIFLWHSKAESRQKTTIAIYLSLSSVMIFISIVRVITMRTPKKLYDYPWVDLWLYLEAGIAMMMVSLTAFRTQFVLREEQNQIWEIYKKPHSLNTPNLQQAPWLAIEGDSMPAIPQAAMTESRGFIIGKKTRTLVMDNSAEEKSERKKPSLLVRVERSDSVYSGADPFITSPSWLQTTHSINRNTNV